jgi:glycine dehydrogenase subunit 2
MFPLIFERHTPGSNTFSLPDLDFQPAELAEGIPAAYLRPDPPELPELSEVQTVRHFTALSHRAYGVDDGFYPLGSCTMKYNPKIGEWAARLPGFANLHPYQDQASLQGILRLLYDMEALLAEIGGMDRFSLQPAAGAHGELTGMMIMKAYHHAQQDFKRDKVLVPDSAHGTNPATCNALGFKVIELKSNAQGLVDLDELQRYMSGEVAGLMLTNPNTLGLFEENIQAIAEIVHRGGGLLYYDGANLNGVMGVARPGDMGFDIVHYNLHKTFAAPHGGGGPGSGPVGVKDFLAEFLPTPTVERDEDGTYRLQRDLPRSIGRVRTFFGNVGVIVKAYTYIMALGGEGIRDACVQAVLNANYLRCHLRQAYAIPYDQLCKHEVVVTAKKQMDAAHVSALDIAKRMIDYGYHPPTIYFPLIVREALMFEPTETESRASLDATLETLTTIAREALEEPAVVKTAPHRAVIKRVDEVSAARKPVIRWTKEP